MIFNIYLVIVVSLCCITLFRGSNADLIMDACNDESSTQCSCELANLTVTYPWMTDCFSNYVCEYNQELDEFCNGNGACNFTNATCMCQRGWGGDDCLQKYEEFVVNGTIQFGLIVLGSLMSIGCLLLMGWVYIYRSVSDVKAMSVTFTQLTLIGCFCVCMHAVVVGIGYNEANCVILEWFVFFGITLLIGCALLKAYRIASIFSSESFSPSDLTDKVLLRYLGIFLGIDIFLLIMYTIFNYMEGGSYERYVIDDTSGRTEYYIEKRCSSQPWTSVSYYALVSWQLLLLLFVLKYGNRTSSASNIFKETTCIYLGSNIGAIFFITFGIFVIFTTNYQFQIAVRGFGSLFVVMLSLGLLFYPKFLSVYHPPRVDEDGLTENERALSKQYEVNLKDRTGKELLLVLDNLVSELASRVDMKMLRLEFNSIDITKIQKLMEKLVELAPDARAMTPINSTSDVHNLETAINDDSKGNQSVDKPVESENS